MHIYLIKLVNKWINDLLVQTDKWVINQNERDMCSMVSYKSWMTDSGKSNDNVITRKLVEADVNQLTNFSKNLTGELNSNDTNS